MWIHELRRERRRLEIRITKLNRIIHAIKSNGYQLPIGRFVEPEANEKEGKLYEYGIFKSVDTEQICDGKYLTRENLKCKFSKAEVSKMEKELMTCEKKLEQVYAQIDKIKEKMEKSPATTAKRNIPNSCEFLKKNCLKENYTREGLEKKLKEIEENHDFIQLNMDLISKSKGVSGKIGRALRSKKILTFGEMQKTAEELHFAIKNEKTFIESFGASSYEEAINLFKYDNTNGVEIIMIYELEEEEEIVIDEVCLKAFDYMCTYIGRELHKKDKIDNNYYQEMLAISDLI